MVSEQHEFILRSRRQKHRIWAFWVLIFIGVAFSAASLLLPPLGVIDNSVLLLVGQILLLAAGIEGFATAFASLTQKVKAQIGSLSETEEEKFEKNPLED